MSHWAELDGNNKVLRVVVGDNNDPAGDEGYSWLIDNLGGTWVKTSYNATIRGVFAGIGYTYDAALDLFVVPKPFDSWLRDGSSWKAPIEMPEDGKFYSWDEELGVWVEAETI